MRVRWRGTLICLIGAWLAAAAHADEGMWTFDHFPAQEVAQRYGVQITPAWLEHVRLATVRLNGCTGSFVSSDGLILTNHHCVESCLAALSSQDANLVDGGFLADERHPEGRCATQVADVLVATEEVTAQITAAVAGLDAAAAASARRRTLTLLEQRCEQASARRPAGRLKCQAVSLYEGGQYFLYEYKRYEDVRLVFAPESDIAAFGGDPDNFQFPRWSLDVSVLRAYENGKPAHTPQHLSIDFDGPREGEPVFVSGHPGTTSRLETRAQLEFTRDVVLPQALLRSAELRGRYLQFAFANAANAALIEAPLDNLENAIKVRRKLLDALHDDALLERKSAEERTLRAAAHLDGEDPWRQIAAALAKERDFYEPYTFIEGGAGFNSILFRYARLLVRGVEERTKPNADRLREFTDAALPRVARQLAARLPVYPEVEAMTLSASLERLREWLGPDDPLSQQLFAHDSPDGVAIRLVAETQIADPAVRQRLWEGGAAAVRASRDPMIELVRGIDPQARALRRRYEDEVDGPITAAAARIARARFAAYGTRVYPDATFTLRLNVGTVSGWNEHGRPIPAFTHLERAFARATGARPFKMPDRWLAAADRLDRSTPFCISTSNDIVGGNSGSPLIDARGRLVGLMFDGNIHSIAGDYAFDAANNRAVALHPAMLRVALEQVYGAHALFAELSASGDALAGRAAAR